MVGICITACQKIQPFLPTSATNSVNAADGGGPGESPGFELIWTPAVRYAQFGKASGGLLVGISRDINKELRIDCTKSLERDVIRIVSTNCELYVLPTYLNCNKWEEDFQIYNRILQEFNTHNVVVIGDLNVQIGESQILMKEQTASLNVLLKPKRNSKDKVLNNKGKRFTETCDDAGIVILNGRTQGDFEGNHTYISTMGCSANDVKRIQWLEQQQKNNSNNSNNINTNIDININTKININTPIPTQTTTDLNSKTNTTATAIETTTPTNNNNININPNINTNIHTNPNTSNNTNTNINTIITTKTNINTNFNNNNTNSNTKNLQQHHQQQQSNP
ncbi:putative uncharacterized protein DDB_G0286901 [Episyrphus balteatus]|uniref:putative uncharacterized protein DDB_G0286901 n=1 Tax=Episyrphus balteatus TaxID=286459 RepID=UPI002486BBB0|nr:putative uncharacterized protein DDB_G0286901 [Episyrphus balteatus]